MPLNLLQRLKRFRTVIFARFSYKWYRISMAIAEGPGKECQATDIEVCATKYYFDGEVSAAKEGNFLPLGSVVKVQMFKARKSPQHEYILVHVQQKGNGPFCVKLERRTNWERLDVIPPTSDNSPPNSVIDLSEDSGQASPASQAEPIPIDTTRVRTKSGGVLKGIASLIQRKKSPEVSPNLPPKRTNIPAVKPAKEQGSSSVLSKNGNAKASERIANVLGISTNVLDDLAEFFAAEPEDKKADLMWEFDYGEPGPPSSEPNLVTKRRPTMPDVFQAALVVMNAKRNYNRAATCYYFANALFNVLYQSVHFTSIPPRCKNTARETGCFYIFGRCLRIITANGDENLTILRLLRRFVKGDLIESSDRAIDPEVQALMNGLPAEDRRTLQFDYPVSPQAFMRRLTDIFDIEIMQRTEELADLRKAKERKDAEAAATEAENVQLKANQKKDALEKKEKDAKLEELVAQQKKDALEKEAKDAKLVELEAQQKKDALEKAKFEEEIANLKKQLAAKEEHPVGTIASSSS